MKRKNINLLLSKPYIHTHFCRNFGVLYRRIAGGQVFKRQKYRTIRTHGVIFFCIFAEYNPASAKAHTQHPRNRAATKQESYKQYTDTRHPV